MSKPRMRVKAELVNTTSEPIYHSASNSRRFAGFGTSSTGANAALNGSLPTLRNRSRHAFRNSPLIKKGIRANVTNTVGTGLIARFRSSDEQFNEDFRKIFDQFVNECDPEGVLNLYSMQALGDLSRRVSGEVFIRRRKRSLTSGLTIPLQLQMLEADFVPVHLEETRKNGNKIKAGIEFNRLGQRVAYWMYKSHPGEADQGADLSKFIRVPASDVIHCYIPQRPGQIRGEPDSTTSLLKVKTYESYDDAELQRKESRSGYTGMLIRKDYEDGDYNFDPFSGRPLYDDVEGDDAQITPGTFITGLPGEDLKLFDGDNTGSGYKDFTREQKLMIASALDCPFELMTGDWSGVNDRIYRAFIQEYRRGIEMVQDHVLVYQFLRRVVDWAIQAAVLAGKVSAPKYASNTNDYHVVEWRPHAWKHIHPVQDIQAQVMAKDNHLNSGDALVAETGYDAEEVDLQNVIAEKRRLDLREEYGLSGQGAEEETDEDESVPEDPDPDESEETDD